MDDTEKEIVRLFEEIYEARKKCGIIRQKICSSVITQLDQKLKKNLQQTHPYNLTHPQKKLLEELVGEYLNGGNGLSAKILSDGYLYRIAGPIDLYGNINSVIPSNKKLFNLAMEFWNKLYNDSGGGQKWLQLSKYGGDKDYSTYSQISWWTRHIIEDSDMNIIANATRLGLFEDWINQQTYLLRCHTEICTKTPLASVPTIIDAFANSVFYTTENKDDTFEGITINLSQAPLLDLGISEIVLKKIKLSRIEVLPVLIKTEDRQANSHINSKNIRILRSLLDYYLQG